MVIDVNTLILIRKMKLRDNPVNLTFATALATRGYTLDEDLKEVLQYVDIQRVQDLAFSMYKSSHATDLIRMLDVFRFLGAKVRSTTILQIVAIMTPMGEGKLDEHMRLLGVSYPEIFNKIWLIWCEVGFRSVACRYTDHKELKTSTLVKGWDKIIEGAYTEWDAVEMLTSIGNRAVLDSVPELCLQRNWLVLFKQYILLNPKRRIKCSDYSGFVKWLETNGENPHEIAYLLSN